MNTPTSTMNSLKAKGLAAAILLCLAGSVHSPRVEASGIPVVDGLNQVYNMVIDEARRFARQCFDVRNLQDALKRVQDIRNINLRTSIGGSTIKLSEAMPAVPVMQGVDSACPDPSGGGLAGAAASTIRDAIGLTTKELDGANLRQEQMNVCRTLVFMRNTKWNTERKVLVELERQTDELVSILDDWNSKVGSGGGSIGDLAKGCSLDSGNGPTEGWQATTGASLQANAEQSERLFKQVQSEVEVYQNIINTLEQRQAEIGRQMLAGQKPQGFLEEAAATMVQGAVLEGALRIGNRQCGEKLGVKC